MPITNNIIHLSLNKTLNIPIQSPSNNNKQLINLQTNELTNKINKSNDNNNNLTINIINSNNNNYHTIITSLQSIQSIIITSNELFNDLINELNQIHCKYNKCKQLIDNLKDKKLDTNITNKSKIQAIINPLDNNKLPNNLLLKYNNLSNQPTSLLNSMDRYIHLTNHKTIKSFNDLYTNPKYFFISWKDKQLQLINNNKKLKKYQTNRLSIDQSKGYDNKISSYNNSSPLTKLSRPKQQKIIAALDWRKRYMINGEPTHVSVPRTRDSNKLKLKRISNRLSFNNDLTAKQIDDRNSDSENNSVVSDKDINESNNDSFDLLNDDLNNQIDVMTLLTNEIILPIPPSTAQLVDVQIDNKVDRQMDEYVDKQINIRVDKQVYFNEESQINVIEDKVIVDDRIDKQIEYEVFKQIDIQLDSQLDKQIDTQIDNIDHIDKSISEIIDVHISEPIDNTISRYTDTQSDVQVDIQLDKLLQPVDANIITNRPARTRQSIAIPRHLPVISSSELAATIPPPPPPPPRRINESISLTNSLSNGDSISLSNNQSPSLSNSETINHSISQSNRQSIRIPPPPPRISSDNTKIETTIQSKERNINTSLLLSIQTGKTLKRLDKQVDTQVDEPVVIKKVSILDAIKSGNTKLKKVDKKVDHPKDVNRNSNDSGLGLFASDAISSILARRKFIESDSDNSDNDWEDE